MYHPPSGASFPFSCPNSTCPSRYNFIPQVLLLVVSEPHLEKILQALYFLSLIVKSHFETPRSERQQLILSYLGILPGTEVSEVGTLGNTGEASAV